MANDLGYAAQAAVAYKDPVTVAWGQQVLDNITALATMLWDYQKGCRLSYVGTGTIEVGTGSIMINGHPRKNTTTSTVTFALSGGAGYTEASSTAYYVWAFASGSTSIFQIGLNLTSSNHTGQTNARLLGRIWNGTGCAIEQLYDYQYGTFAGLPLDRTNDYGAQAALTDGILRGYAVGNNDNAQCYVYSDTAADPATLVYAAGQTHGGATNGRIPISCYILKGNNWKVTVSNAAVTILQWIPLGSSIM